MDGSSEVHFSIYQIEVLQIEVLVDYEVCSLAITKDVCDVLSANELEMM